MEFLLLTGVFPLELRKEIERNSKQNIQYAADALQWNYIRGFRANCNNRVTIVNAPLIGSFPFYYKQLFIKKSHKITDQKSKDISIGYFNLAIIKNYFIERALLKEVNHLVKENAEEVKIIIVYGMLAPWVLTAIKIKKKYSSIKLCLIVPDLPKFMSDSRSIVLKFRNFLLPDLYKFIPNFDSFVFLTDKMAEHFNVTDRPWIRIEGMINTDELSNIKRIAKSSEKVIMYSGTLTMRYGVLDLIAAFEEISNPNYELWLCGEGDSSEIIRDKAKINKRVKYFGIIPRERVLALQQKATVLVNPRNPEGEYTKYSFPSKTMEYLLSGTPCIMYPLPALPKEYEQYIFLVKESGIKALKNKIIEVCEMDEKTLFEIGLRAQTFVTQNKNYINQTKRMIEMLGIFC